MKKHNKRHKLVEVLTRANLKRARRQIFYTIEKHNIVIPEESKQSQSKLLRSLRNNKVDVLVLITGRDL